MLGPDEAGPPLPRMPRGLPNSVSVSGASMLNNQSPLLRFTITDVEEAEERVDVEFMNNGKVRPSPRLAATAFPLGLLTESYSFNQQGNGYAPERC